MLTIDYGARADDLYQRQPNGSIRAYLLQQRIDGSQIYQNPGRQDITADVNFTDLENWSLPWVSENKLSYLRDFLQDYAEDSLTDLDGAGNAFLVLDQKR
jgi:SAM-dependent MidA family methyltransferase